MMTPLITAKIKNISRKRLIHLVSIRTFSLNKKPVPIVDLNHPDRNKTINQSDVDSTSGVHIQRELQNELSRIVRPYYEAEEPVLIRNFIDSATPAIHRWNDLDYLCDKVGYNTPCSVEIGGSYNSNIARNEILFGDYIDYMNLFHEQFGRTSINTCTGDNKVMENDNRPQPEQLVYMAQNHLFSPLKDDFTMPELVGSVDNANSKNAIGHGHVYSTMIWFGPSYCVSPLHYDPLDNLLMGFVGRKKIVLFPKDENDADDYDRTANSTSNHGKSEEMKWHYGGYNGQQYNTSPIDIGNPDYNLYPNFENAPQALECLLQPGEILFIPKRWWHHVTSLDTAVSVNIWWR